MMDLLQNMIFPPTDQSKLDILIQKCWSGGFNSIEALSDQMISLDSATARVMEKAAHEMRQKECRQLVKRGILDEIES